MGNYIKRLIQKKIYIPTNTKEISYYIPPIKYAYVIKVYDGDTITVVVNIPWYSRKAYKFNVRLYGIDCPEMRTKDTDEKEIAIKAKQFVETLCNHKTVELQNIQLGKYAKRIVADVIIDEKNISHMLLDNNLAVNYYGKKKKTPFNWKKYYNLKHREL